MAPVDGKSASIGKNVEVTQMHDVCDFPSRYVLRCLSAIEDAAPHRESKSFVFNPWALEFSNSYSSGKDLLETSGTSATTGQIAWIVSGVADTLVRKEEEGLSVGRPFLLFLVPSSKKLSRFKQFASL